MVLAVRILEVWMHLESFESTQEASYSYASVLQTSSIHPYLNIPTLSMNQFLVLRGSQKQAFLRL